MGVTKATVSKWETGRAEPSLDYLCKIRALYHDVGVTLDALIAGEAPPTEPDEAGVPAMVFDPPAPYGAGSIRTESVDETHLVVRYRQLKPKQRKGLLALLADL